MSNATACVMKEVNIMEMRSPGGALYTTLPMEQLIELVENEIRELISYDGFEYTSPQGAVQVLFGTPRQHKCQYRITIGELPVGQVTLSRRQPFDAGEINLIEGALGALIVHLHNAMEFQQELGHEVQDALRLDRALVALR